jgi:heat shock protein HtpX
VGDLNKENAILAIVWGPSQAFDLGGTTVCESRRAYMSVSRSLAFRALLAIVLMVGYYAFALAISAALLWVPYAEYEYLSRLDFRVAAVCWGAALTILWALVPRADHFEPPGPQLTPESEPQLFAMIEDVAAATSQQRPSEVYLLNEVNAWVSQRGGFMGFGSKRVMGVGLPLMTNMTRPELRAVIAHEFGHYCSGDVGIGPLIYKTRAAIARTLVGVDETFLQSVFNWYAKVFMRLTMAVSRQQEFVADETAARVAGAAPMVNALRKVSMLGPAYGTYLQQEVFPVLQSGFMPPLTEGFERFMACPETDRALRLMTRKHTTGTNTGEFDTHPPMTERVTALELLQSASVAESTDDITPVLSDSEQKARELLELGVGSDSMRQLRDIQWKDVGTTVYAEIWKRMTARHADWFGTTTIDQLPSGKRAYEDLGRQFRGKMNISSSEERIETAARMMAAGIGTALMRAGWRVETSPGQPIELINGSARVIPREVITRLVENVNAFKEWKETCDALGITGLPLRPSEDAAPATT